MQITMKCKSDKIIIFLLFIFVMCVEFVLGRISKNTFINQKGFTNFVYRPDKNSPELPAYTSGVELIKKNGYPLEIHEIVTKDGYILNTFRIPCGRNSACNANITKYKPPVIAFHPIGLTSDVWVQSLKVENCLAFVLADAGYDVWLPNARATHYSNTHLFLDNTQTAYWNYSFDEIGKYDVPANVEYILEKTGKPKAHIISYSSSSITVFSAAATYPDLNDKIALHISYAPTIYFDEIGIVLPLAAATFVDVLQLMQRQIGDIPFSRERATNLLSRLGAFICHPKVDTLGLCRKFFFTIYGHSNISREQITAMAGHGHSLASLKLGIHFLQLINSGHFQEYDYGAVGNLREYGQPNTPKYNLREITSPVAFIVAQYDYIATQPSTEKLALNLGNVVDYHVIPNNEFSHADFCCGENAYSEVYKRTIDLLNRFSFI